MEAIGCSETSGNYPESLRNIPEEGKFRLHRGRSLKSRNRHSESNNFIVTLKSTGQAGSRWYTPDSTFSPF